MARGAGLYPVRRPGPHRSCVPCPPLPASETPSHAGGAGGGSAEVSVNLGWRPTVAALTLPLRPRGAPAPKLALPGRGLAPKEHVLQERGTGKVRPGAN